MKSHQIRFVHGKECHRFHKIVRKNRFLDKMLLLKRLWILPVQSHWSKSIHDPPWAHTSSHTTWNCIIQKLLVRYTSVSSVCIHEWHQVILFPLRSSWYGSIIIHIGNAVLIEVQWINDNLKCYGVLVPNWSACWICVSTKQRQFWLRVQAERASTITLTPVSFLPGWCALYSQLAIMLGVKLIIPACFSTSWCSTRRIGAPSIGITFCIGRTSDDS